MMIKMIQTLCQVLVYLNVLVNARKSQADILYRDLFTDYNKDVLPQESYHRPVEVNMTFLLTGIRELDEVTGKFSVMAIMYLTWTDFRLKWNPSSYNNTKALVVPDSRIWKPNPVVMNPYDNMKGFVQNVFTITLYNNGGVVWIPGDIISSACDFDMTYYPFDVQVCSIEFTCWGLSAYFVELRSPVSQVPLTFYSEDGSWRIVNTTVESYFMGSSLVTVKIALRRRPTFVMVNFILPVVFMTVLNLLVFILPMESGERVSYAVTVLLAIAVFFTLVGENLPKTSFRSALVSYFLLSYLILSTVICAFVIISSSWYYSNKTRPVPKTYIRLARKFRSLNFQSEKKYTLEENADSGKVSSELDEIVSWKTLSRWLDNVVFSICLLVVSASIILFFIIVYKDN